MILISFLLLAVVAFLLGWAAARFDALVLLQFVGDKNEQMTLRKAFNDWPHRVKVDTVRAIGLLVCLVKGYCKYPGYSISFNSWTAYGCVRCGRLSQPMCSLTPPPEDYDHWDDHDDRDQVDEDNERARRWFARLPWPRWV